VRGQLRTLCPWHQLAAQLDKGWHIGHTDITFVDSLPFSSASAAIRAAAAGNGRPTTLVVCDLAYWPSRTPLTAARLLVWICSEVAQKLGLADTLPTAAVLPTLSASAVRREIMKLCRRAQDRCVVVYISHAHRLLNQPDSRQLIGALADLKQCTDNLALTLESDHHEDTGKELASLLSTTRNLTLRIVPTPLLSARGVARWLQLQLDPYGICCDKKAVELVYRLTGGQQFLLVSLGKALAVDCETRSQVASNYLVLGEKEIEHAADSQGYKQNVRRLGKRLLRKHGYDYTRRLLLRLLADITANAPQPASVTDLVQCSTAYTTLDPDYVQAALDAWCAGNLVEKIDVTKPARYRLRSLSVAKWLLLQKPLTAWKTTSFGSEVFPKD
jgi:hypothetical protein